MISDDFLPAATGVGTHLKVVAPRLVQQGHRVVVLTTRRAGEPSEEVWRGVKVLRMPTVRLFGFDQALPSTRRVRRILRDEKIDVVHHHYLGLMLLRALSAGLRARIPQVYTYHMTVDHLTQPWPMRPLRPLLAGWIRSTCDRFARILVPSKVLAEIVRSSVHAPVYYLTNPLPYDSSDLAAPVPPTEGPFTVLFAGRLEPEKNVTFLLRAFAELRRRVPGGAKLRIAGKGSLRGDLEKECAALGIVDDVTFLGFLDAAALADEYRACSVFVLPSHVETQGLVALEAMAFGKPIVVADSFPASRELVEDGDNGYLVRGDDTRMLAARLEALARDPARAAAMGARGASRREQYDPAEVVAQLLDHYAEVIALGCSTGRAGAPLGQRARPAGDLGREPQIAGSSPA